MDTHLNQVEKDFIEFLSQKRNRSYREVEDVFLITKERFNFSGSEYRKLADTIHNLFKIMYDDVDERDIIDAYKFHALMQLFRFISYSYPASSPSYPEYLKAFIKMASRGEFNNIYIRIKRRILTKGNKSRDPGLNGNYASIARFLLNQIDESPVVVDYGCGLGYISFEIGKMGGAKIYLVDIDCLTLEFAEFRFKKHGINAEVIRVSKEDLYPRLPAHNICIATEVMEHVMQPLMVYQNIYDNLGHRGILFGDFEDHQKEMFHISPDLRELVERIGEDFQAVSSLCYRKIK